MVLRFWNEEPMWNLKCMLWIENVNDWPEMRSVAEAPHSLLLACHRWPARRLKVIMLALEALLAVRNGVLPNDAVHSTTRFTRLFDDATGAWALRAGQNKKSMAWKRRKTKLFVCTRLGHIFTALHGMQRGLTMRFLSVCLSVCQTRVFWQNGRKICPDFYTMRKIILSSFMRRRMVGGGDPFYLKFWVNQPALERNRWFWTNNRS